MIALDSVGSRLGVVANCNSQTKRLLGYEKAALIGKNITRTMPNIYSDLHNNFLLKFISRKDGKTG
jgi:PAS domain-containing protein